MFKLTKNELFKAFKQKKLYVFMAVIILMEILIVGYYSINNSGGIASGLNGQTFPLNLIGGIQQLVIIFLAVYVADNICEEYKSGTLKLPLLRPVTRNELLISKIISTVVLIAIILVFMLVTSYIIGTIGLGWGNSMIISGDTFTTIHGVTYTFLAAIASLLPTLAFTMILVCISLFITDMGLTIVMALALLLSDRFFESFTQIKDYLIIYQMNNFPLNATVYFTWDNVLKSITILIGYIVIFYLLSLVIIKKKDILL